MTEAALEARRLLAEAERLVVLSGAGLSAESGVPTFRGAGGLWRNHRPEQLATPEAFRRDPCLVWAWYAWRRELVASCTPNEGHLAIARRAGRGGVTIVTQNVDGLHGRAARAFPQPPDAPAIAELHGALDRDRCSACGVRSEPVVVDTASVDTLPRCARCAALLRPDVVWFGEGLDPDVLSGAFEAAARADVCLVVGTSALVHPAASIPLATLDSGGRVVEVNPDATPLSRHAAACVRDTAAGALPRLLG